MARRAPLFLALDQGGHASRALVFDARSNLIATAEKRISTRHPARDRVEHDPKALIASMRLVCRNIARQLGQRTAQIRCAGLATQRSTIVCWDRKTGNALSPVISWQDRRAARRVQALKAHAGAVHKITGLVLSPHYGASKLAWCLDRLPPVRCALRQQRLATGPLASFIMFNLLLEKPLLADPANASRTLLWDYRSRDWSPELLKLFKIPAGILPQCVPTQYAFGHLRLGEHKVPLTLVTGDQPAALFACGQPHADWSYINIGTGAFIQQPHGRRLPRVAGLLGSVLWQDQKRALYVLEATVNGAGSALLWLRERLVVAESRMSAEMSRWLDLEGIPLFINGISGLGSPYWVPSLRSRFIGRGTSAQQFAAVVESIVFLLCVNLDRMRKSHIHMRRIVITGGLAQWDGVCQRLADLTGLVVLRPRLYEATARGLAWLLRARPRRATHGTKFKPIKNLLLEMRYRRWHTALQRQLKSQKDVSHA